ncbi:MAG: glutamine--fructose-6-phosphate transaminase (isomerizing), partial [Planctomycetota bacterium]
MCGIFGMCAQRNVAPTLVDGLGRLEYRGYDSCGVVVLSDDGSLSMRKGAGEVARVAADERFAELHGNSGIAHTRWATHGRVSRQNSHPHFSPSGEVAIVHNGIIDNYEELRRHLEAKGHDFKSQTDSEVVAHLIQVELAAAPSVEEAIVRALAQLDGTYALGVICTRTPGVLYAARSESPLILGIGDDFRCFASDPLAFSPLSSEVVFLEDGEMVIVDAEGYRIRRLDSSKEIRRPSVRIELDADAVDLGAHPDYMSKEIAENSVVTRTALDIPGEKIDAIVDAIRATTTTYLTGMGTAYYVALMAQYIFSRYGGRFLPVVTADELPYLVKFSPSDHIIAVSQSGETYDTLRALRLAHRAGATTSAVLNVPTSSMAREVDRHIHQQAGPEICVLSTKATISQLVILTRVALRLGEREGTLAPEVVQSCQDELRRLPALFDRLWGRSHDPVKDLARRFSVIRNWFFLGRGIYYGLAMEGALKFKEV